MERNSGLPDKGGELSLPNPEDYSEPLPEKILSPDDIALEGMMQSPEAAMAHAVESIDEPIEGVREQRVEKKGDNFSQTPVPVSSVIAGMPQPQQTDEASRGAPPPLEPPVMTAIPPSYNEEEEMITGPKPSLYQRAVFSGFLFGLVIILFFVLTKLLF